MAPYATMILALPSLLFEGAGVVEWLYTFPSVVPSMLLIFLSGVLAFCLNFSIFYVIHSTTAVTFNVAGNLKVSSSPFPPTDVHFHSSGFRASSRVSCFKSYQIQDPATYFAFGPDHF